MQSQSTTAKRFCRASRSISWNSRTKSASPIVRSSGGVILLPMLGFGLCASGKAKGGEILASSRALASEGEKRPRFHKTCGVEPFVYELLVDVGDAKSGLVFGTLEEFKKRLAGAVHEGCPHQNIGVQSYVPGHGHHVPISKGNTLERAQSTANHASTRTTQLYDGRADKATFDHVERIRLG